jgi:hypothetical protein
VCQWPATGWWFSPGTPVSSTNKTDRHDIIENQIQTCIVERGIKHHNPPHINWQTNKSYEEKQYNETYNVYTSKVLSIVLMTE